MNKKQLIEELKKHDYNYHTIGHPTISDSEYDKLKDELYKMDPKNAYFRRVGADMPNSVKLPYYLGSLNKIRDDTKAINNWIKTFKGPYYVSEKLDGISALYDIKNNKMYTRGNGTYGSDISYVLPYISMPDTANTANTANITISYIRGELIIPNDKWKASMGTNARNTVAGVVNAKILNQSILKHVKFVPYTVIEPVSSIEKIRDINGHVKIESIDDLSIDNLQKTLKEWKELSKYEIDGIVITQQGEYPIKTGDNPKHAFAFKSINTHQIMDVTVTKVEWNESKGGLLKPRVLFNAIRVDGAEISAASGHNARFIQENKIGVGAVISIIRSGGVIPKIQHVVSPADTVSMPTVTWTWNDKHVEAIAVQESAEQKIQEILNFFKKLGVKGVGKKIIELLYNNGFNNIEKLLELDYNTLSNVKGVGKKTIDLLTDSITNIKSNASLIDIMVASNMFKNGIGEKKLKNIVDNMPNIMEQHSMDDIKKINGIGEATAKQFVENLDTFKIFHNKYFRKHIVKQDISSQKYKEYNIVFTGFRDKQLEKVITDGGGKISSTVSKKSTHVVAKDISGNSGTLQKARELGVEIIDKQSLLRTLSITL